MSLNINQTKLLNNLISDEKKFNKQLYSAGPYWDYKAKKIIYWLKKRGIKNFRSNSSGVGSGFADNLIIDIRNELGLRGRLVSILTKFPFIKRIFDQQISLTSGYLDNYLRQQQIYLGNNNNIKNLISKYKIENSTEFGCLNKFKFGNKEFSVKYLEMCERLEFIRKFLNLDDINSFMEIGGGFGSNIHVLLTNFKNIKKIFYIDIVPNLFVGTEYLKKFFKDSVIDYNFTRDLDRIAFENNDKLEIICVPPWQIDKISAKIDFFHNSASFQEMTIKQVENYKKIIEKKLNKNLISLIVYKGWEKNNTLSPQKINEIFEKKLIQRNMPTFLDPSSDLISLTSI